MNLPVKTLAMGDWTPLDDWTELRPKEAVMGMEPKKAPIMLPIPNANISWLASIFDPPAVSQFHRMIKTWNHSNEQEKFTESFSNGHVFQNGNQRYQSDGRSGFRQDIHELEILGLIAIRFVQRKCGQVEWRQTRFNVTCFNCNFKLIKIELNLIETCEREGFHVHRFKNKSRQRSADHSYGIPAGGHEPQSPVNPSSCQKRTTRQQVLQRSQFL